MASPQMGSEGWGKIPVQVTAKSRSDRTEARMVVAFHHRFKIGTPSNPIPPATKNRIVPATRNMPMAQMMEALRT